LLSYRSLWRFFTFLFFFKFLIYIHIIFFFQTRFFIGILFVRGLYAPSYISNCTFKRIITLNNETRAAVISIESVNYLYFTIDRCAFIDFINVSHEIISISTYSFFFRITRTRFENNHPEGIRDVYVSSYYPQSLNEPLMLSSCSTSQPSNTRVCDTFRCFPELQDDCSEDIVFFFFSFII
jgi:hypothetical protein